MYTLIVVDDEKNIRDSIQTVIMTACPNIKVTATFSDGEECYNYLLKNHVDIVITDIRLPGKTGLQITEMLKKTYPTTKIIIITAYHEFEYANKAFEYKVSNLLVKPFSSQKLADSLNTICQQLTQQKNIDSDEINRYLTDWKFKRKLFSTAVNSKDLHADFDAYSDMLLCCTTKQISDLMCFLLIITMEEPNNLNIIDNSIIDLGEIDNYHLSEFYIGCNDKKYILLAFSDDQSAVYNAGKDICSGIINFTNSTATFDITKYNSLTDMHNSIIYNDIMNSFISELTASNLNISIEQLNRKILSMSVDQQKGLIDFLISNYNLNDFTLSQTFSSETIIKMIEHIAKRYLLKKQDSYPIEKIWNFLESHYSDPNLSLDSMAESLNISSGHLSRIFRKHFGDNYTSSINSYRMEKACELLKTTNLSLTNISADVGFRYPSYFRLSFKKHTGITPSQYRILHHKID